MMHIPRSSPPHRKYESPTASTESVGDDKHFEQATDQRPECVQGSSGGQLKSNRDSAWPNTPLTAQGRLLTVLAIGAVDNIWIGPQCMSVTRVTKQPRRIGSSSTASNATIRSSRKRRRGPLRIPHLPTQRVHRTPHQKTIQTTSTSVRPQVALSTQSTTGSTVVPTA